jgi:hypothetical protein
VTVETFKEPSSTVRRNRSTANSSQSGKMANASPKMKPGQTIDCQVTRAELPTMASGQRMYRLKDPTLAEAGKLPNVRQAQYLKWRIRKLAEDVAALCTSRTWRATR